jgi:hypothetical protein
MAATPINQKQPGDSGYVYFYNGKEIALYAKSAADAKDKAVAYFKPPKSKRHMVHGMIAENSSGEQVVHSTASI